MDNKKDFWVECDVCKQHLKNHVGSTPCCGSIAYLVEENGEVGKDFVLNGSMNGGPMENIKITGK